MKISRTLPFVFLTIIWLISSCSIINYSSGYDANPVFAPFHDKAGQLKANLGYGRVLGVQSNLSYSLTNHLAIMAGGVYNHQTIQTISLYNPDYFKMKSHYVEGALGYYFPVNWWIFTKVEIFAGLGSGIVNKKTDSDKKFSGSYSGVKSNYTKPFLQISAQKPVTDNFEVGFANRISYLQFNQLNIYYQRQLTDIMHYYTGTANTLVTEPVLIFNYGNRLKATTQIGLAIPLTNKSKTNGESNASSIFQLGINFTLK